MTDRLEATRAAVLARGLGTRMKAADARADLTDAQRRAADSGVKAMMPIAGRPFLDFLLSNLADAGLRDVAVVVAPEHDVLAHYYTVTAPPMRVRLSFVVQPEALGTANAVLSVRDWAGGSPFLVMNGDNLYPAEALQAVAALDEPGLPGFVREQLVRSSNIEPARVNAFALIQTDDRGYLTRIVEKPPAGEFDRAGPSALVSMNCWRFDERIFAACHDVAPSPRGELELPVAVGLAVARGVPFKVVPALGPVLDLSQRADTAEVTHRLAGIDPLP